MGEDGGRGADQGFARSLVAHGSRLFRIAKGVLRDLHWAEDAVAETYLKAWQRRDTLRNERRLNPWLAKVCRREALRLRRGIARLGVQPLPHDVPDGHAPLPKGHWDEPAYRADLLARLPKELRVCASMFFVEGRSYAEIATITGLPLSTVRGRISLCRDRLRKEIEMSTETTGYDILFRAPVLRAKGRTAEWHGCRMRYLGSCWTGSRTLYDARGKRLSRLPAGLADTGLLEGGPFMRGRYTGPTLSFFWRLTGKQPFRFGGNAVGTATGSGCQPSSSSWVSADRASFHRQRTGPAGNADTAVRLRTLVWGEPHRDDSRTFRVDLWPGGMATSKPGWGALFVFAPTRGAKKGITELRLAYSSETAEWGSALFGLDVSGEEVESTCVGGGNSECPDGHIRGETYELDIPPDDLKGLVIYPRHRVVINWGRANLPPRLPEK